MLISLRESAPVGPFGLVARSQEDVGRLVTALHSFGYYKGSVAVTIDGLPIDDVNLPDRLDRAPAEPPVKVAVAVTLGPLFHLRKVTVEGAVPEAARANSTSPPARRPSPPTCLPPASGC